MLALDLSLPNTGGRPRPPRPASRPGWWNPPPARTPAAPFALWRVGSDDQTDASVAVVSDRAGLNAVYAAAGAAAHTRVDVTGDFVDLGDWRPAARNFEAAGGSFVIRYVGETWARFNSVRLENVRGVTFERLWFPGVWNIYAEYAARQNGVSAAVVLDRLFPSDVGSSACFLECRFGRWWESPDDLPDPALCGNLIDARINCSVVVDRCAFRRCGTPLTVSRGSSAHLLNSFMDEHWHDFAYMSRVGVGNLHRIWIAGCVVGQTYDDAVQAFLPNTAGWRVGERVLVGGQPVGRIREIRGPATIGGFSAGGRPLVVCDMDGGSFTTAQIAGETSGATFTPTNVDSYNGAAWNAGSILGSQHRDILQWGGTGDPAGTADYRVYVENVYAVGACVNHHASQGLFGNYTNGNGPQAAHSLFFRNVHLASCTSTWGAALTSPRAVAQGVSLSWAPLGQAVPAPTSVRENGLRPDPRLGHYPSFALTKLEGAIKTAVAADPASYLTIVEQIAAASIFRDGEGWWQSSGQMTPAALETNADRFRTHSMKAQTGATSYPVYYGATTGTWTAAAGDAIAQYVEPVPRLTPGVDYDRRTLMRFYAEWIRSEREPLAWGGWGSGWFRDPREVIEAGPPAEPGVSIVSQDASGATFAVAAPAFDGGSAVTGYTLEVFAFSAPGTVVDTVALTPAEIMSTVAWTGGDGGEDYGARVTATNAVGSGPAATAGDPAAADYVNLFPAASTVMTTADGWAGANGAGLAAPVEALDGDAGIWWTTLIKAAEGDSWLARFPIDVAPNQTMTFSVWMRRPATDGSATGGFRLFNRTGSTANLAFTTVEIDYATGALVKLEGGGDGFIGHERVRVDPAGDGVWRVHLTCTARGGRTRWGVQAAANAGEVGKGQDFAGWSAKIGSPPRAAAYAPRM